MKYVFPLIDQVFDTEMEQVNTLVIEHQKLLVMLLSDLYDQLQGKDGKAVISKNDSVLRTDKNAELLHQFVPFDLNKKVLVSKLLVAMEKCAVDEDHYAETMRLLSEIEAYLRGISFDFACDIDFGKLGISAVLKAAGLEFRSDKESLAMQILDYFELVTEFEQNKLFFTLNLRSFISDEEAKHMIDSVLKHGYNMIMIESSEHPLLPNERRYIVDSSLCEIC